MTETKKPITRVEPITYTYMEDGQEKTIDGFTVRHYDPEHYPRLKIPYKKEEEETELRPPGWKSFPQNSMPVKIFFIVAMGSYLLFFSWAAVMGIGMGLSRWLGLGGW